MRAINLLPREEQRQGLGGARVPLLAAACGAAMVVVFAVVLVVSASGAADGLQADLEAVEAAIAAVPRGPDQAVSQATLAQERSDRVAALAAALSNRVAFDRLFREISYVLPEDAWLTGVAAAAPVRGAADAAPGSTPQSPSSRVDDVTIQGATYSHESVARVLSRLAATPSLGNVRLVSANSTDVQAAGDTAAKKKKKSKVVVTFAVAATLRSVGPS